MIDNKNDKTFYSNGKLLITSEYLILDGAKALALPTKFGQNLVVKNIENKQTIYWKSFDYDTSIWFEDTITFEEIKTRATFENQIVKNTLIEILYQGFLMNPSFTNTLNGFEIETHLTFPKKWGLGTSSTLINNIAQWLMIDAYDLLKNSFGGSGYDIACAQNDSPILYHFKDKMPIVSSIKFEPIFKDKIYFLYLNRKQNSREAINNYYTKQKDIYKSIPIFNSFTEKIIATNNNKEFEILLEKHEYEMSLILELQTVKKTFFSDFDGLIKSLGAWGGDFVMVVCDQNPSSYFKEKGYETILTYDEMILS